jgi:alcohol dehydrogenase
MSNEIIPVKEIYSNGAWSKIISIMKSLVCNGSGKMLYTDVSKSKIEKPTDTAANIVKTTICGIELGILQGKTTTVEPRTTFCYEGVGIIEEVVTSVVHFKKGNFTQFP